MALKLVRGFVLQVMSILNFNTENFNMLANTENEKILICKKGNSAMRNVDRFSNRKKYDYRLGNMKNT